MILFRLESEEILRGGGSFLGLHWATLTFAPAQILAPMGSSPTRFMATAAGIAFGPLLFDPKAADAVVFELV